MIAGALAIDAGAIVVVVLLFALVVPFEKLFPRHRGQGLRRPQVLTDIGFADYDVLAAIDPARAN